MIGMGEMGAAIAQRLAERGGRVVTPLAGRSAASVARAQAVGAHAVTPDALGQADIILSVVPPAAAPRVAAECLPHLASRAHPPLFIDCNAIAPQTVAPVAASYETAGVPFGDGSLIGGPPRPGAAGPRLYLSGPVTEAAATLSALGLDACALSAAIGDASALKMAYAGITKGTQAIGAAMALGAFRNGAGESLLAELAASQPATLAALSRQLPAMLPKAYRWDGEMREIARFLEPEAGAARMMTGAADLYQHIAEDVAEGEQSEIVQLLRRFRAPQE
ncbi:MAG: NAD(P)-dependent oxidoreductase [Acuticoccus sp.]